jgi:hypothetical protein
MAGSIITFAGKLFSLLSDGVTKISAVLLVDKDGNPVSGLSVPASGGAAVVPSDTVDLPFVARALYVGGFGNLSLISADGSAITLVDAHGWVPVRAARVRATGTTATSIVALR